MGRVLLSCLLCSLSTVCSIRVTAGAHLRVAEAGILLYLKKYTPSVPKHTHLGYQQSLICYFAACLRFNCPSSPWFLGLLSFSGCFAATVVLFGACPGGCFATYDVVIGWMLCHHSWYRWMLCHCFLGWMLCRHIAIWVDILPPPVPADALPPFLLL